MLVLHNKKDQNDNLRVHQVRNVFDVIKPVCSLGSTTDRFALC